MSAPIRIRIDLERTPSGILTGAIESDEGCWSQFTGVLGLVAVLERVLDQRAEHE